MQNLYLFSYFTFQLAGVKFYELKFIDTILSINCKRLWEVGADAVDGVDAIHGVDAVDGPGTASTHMNFSACCITLRGESF